MTLFPTGFLLSLLALFCWAVTPTPQSTTFWSIVMARMLAWIAWLFLLPPILHRAHLFFFPLKEGQEDLSGKKHSPWWGSHQLQVIFIACPTLENLLRLIPGAYSGWLRLWGAKVGKRVYWTPNIEIVDRSLVEIGDDVVIGHRTRIFSHVIRPRKGKPTLFLKKVTIGSGSFIGAFSFMSPGAEVPPDSKVEFSTGLGICEKFDPQKHKRDYVVPSG